MAVSSSWRRARRESRAARAARAPRVDVEVHLGSGLPTFSIVGLPATAVKESKDRVRAALANSGFELPAGRITVNLSPADLPKEGCRYDLPIALGILLASSQVEFSERNCSTDASSTASSDSRASSSRSAAWCSRQRMRRARGTASWCRRPTSPRRAWPRGRDRVARRALLEVCALRRQCSPAGRRRCRRRNTGSPRIDAEPPRRSISPMCAARRRRSVR